MTGKGAIIGLLTVIVFLSNFAHANDNLLVGDSTVRQYERKALLQLRDIGLVTNNIKLPVTYCPYKAKFCRNKRGWGYSISGKEEAMLGSSLLKQLGGKRYDNIQINHKNILIVTIDETIELETELSGFNFGTGTQEHFKNKSLEYLNTEIAPLMTRLLSKAKDARYQQMPDKEKQTFLTSIAKEESVPVSFITKLMDSAYAFSVHLSHISGLVRIDQEKKKNAFGNEYMSYDTNVSAKITTTLNIFHYDVNESQFKFYKDITRNTGSTTVSEDFLHYPNERIGQRLFTAALSKAIYNAGMATNTTLKEDDNFAIYATIDQTDGNEFKARIGELEDLRVDAPYYVYQYVDGKPTKMGWAKVRNVSTEATYKENFANYYSDFDLIAGDIEFKDQLREHPWTGVLLYIGVGSMQLSLESLNDKPASGGGIYSGLNFGVTMDRGFMKNDASDSESWLTFDLNFAFIGGEELKTDIGDYNSGWAGKLSILGNSRFYPGAIGLFLSYQYGLGISLISAGPKTEGDTLTITSFGPSLGLKLGFNSSPDREYSLSLDYMYPVFAKASLGENKPEFEAELSPAISLTFQFAFHTHSSTVPVSTMH